MRSPARQELPPEVMPVAVDPVLERVGGRHRVSYRLAIPYFGLLWRPLVARRARRIERAADRGEPLPAGRPWWAMPDHLDEQAQVTLGVAALLTAVYSYGGGTLGLLSLTLPAAADTYSAGDEALAVGLAVVRVGVLLALAVGTLADRIGRRRMIVWAALAHCGVAATIGLAPTLGTYFGGHLVLRLVDTALAIALTVIVAERVSAGSRAFALALLAAASGLGIALAAFAIPLAQSGRGGFALAYCLQLVALPLVIDAARRLPESPRFVRHSLEPHGYREALRRPYGWRLAMLGGASLLGAAFIAPALEFLTQYLDDERGLESLEIVMVLGAMGLAAGPGLVVGARLADLYGRRPVAVPAFTAALACMVSFYLLGTPWIFLAAPAFAALGTAGGAAVGPYGSELFPTRVRAAAQTLILALTILGSMVGLLGVGLLSRTLELGDAIAVAGSFALVAVILVAALFPETARLELEQTSDEEA